MGTQNTLHIVGVVIGVAVGIFVIFSMLGSGSPAAGSIGIGIGAGIGTMIGINTIIIQAFGPPDQIHDNAASLQYKQARDTNRIANHLDRLDRD